MLNNTLDKVFLVFVHESSEGTFTVVSLTLFENVVSLSQCEDCSQRTCCKCEVPDIRNLDCTDWLSGAVYLPLLPCLGWKHGELVDLVPVSPPLPAVSSLVACLCQ